METRETTKMKLTIVRNTNQGNESIGCRATGIHKGFHIERTAWQTVSEFSGNQSFEWLEKLAASQYNSEVRAIDTKLKSKAS